MSGSSESTCPLVSSSSSSTYYFKMLALRHFIHPDTVSKEITAIGAFVVVYLGQTYSPCKAAGASLLIVLVFGAVSVWYKEIHDRVSVREPTLLEQLRRLESGV
jgi:hypothetical protein